MSASRKWMLVALVSIIAVGATAVFGVVAWQQYQLRQSAPSAADAVYGATPDGARLVFRNTASGSGYGHLASVPLDDPGGQRSVEGLVCDRVDVADESTACLRIERGIVPRYTAAVYDAQGTQTAEWTLAGIPSRTRFSPDGGLVATTSFVTGHSYATIGFSTETRIHRPDGTDLGDLEDWTLLIDGVPSAPLDRNYWGITFVDDSSFYATVGMTTVGATYLVRGDIATKTLTTLAENVECPSLSPDGTRIAFKRVTSGTGPTVHWTPAIYEIATGEITALPEARSIDDQIEWLDDDTILYGMPRADAVGDTDVWRLEADGSGEPRVFLEHAWSPAVVRSGS